MHIKVMHANLMQSTSERTQIQKVFEINRVAYLPKINNRESTEIEK